MQRNGQNPIKNEKSGSRDGNAFRQAGASPLKQGGGVPHCPSCKTEVPPKPGFRVSSLKCPKCGASLAGK